MSARLPSSFGSYDLFAKAFPGIVFLLFAVLLLPQQAISSDFAQSGALVAAFVVFVLVFGFVFGQALHSMSVWTEKRFYAGSRSWFEASILISKVAHVIYDWITDQVGWERERSQRESMTIRIVFVLAYTIVLFITYSVSSEEAQSVIVRGIFLGILLGLIATTFVYLALVDLVREWFSQTLIPHRRQFGTQMSDSDTEEQDGVWLSDIFDDKVQDIYEFEYSREKKDDLDLVYTLTMSHLSRDGGRAKQFQAVFAFCRSMWVTLLFYSIVYGAFGLKYTTWNFVLAQWPPIDQLIHYRPIILSQVGGGNSLLTIGIMMFVISFLFMEGERQYKSLFVDYVMADFLTNSPNTSD